MTKSDTAPELVFVYGTLRRGGSNAFRMDGAEFVASAEVSGRLYHISWYPGLVLGRGKGMVTGDLFRVGPEQMKALDEFEGISANEVEGAEYRRVKATAVIEHIEALSAWVYEWKGPVAEERRIASGDWFDVVQPRPRPVFTTLCLVFAVCCVPSLGAAGLMPNDLAALLLMIGLPGCGVISGWVGLRRNERWPWLRSVGVGVCFVWLIVVSFFAVALFVG
jgi:gamma-glutamylcyclotransferase (GGCT)/AIG2-like uncharacterized protein YtfP